MNPWGADPATAGVFSDFDGTLSAIVPRAEDARPLDGAVAVLEELARRYAVVAVVSGRPASFLAEHVPAKGVLRWGAYGLERVGPFGDVEIDPAALEWVPVVASVVAAADVPDGVRVEDKGISVTFHYRGAPTLEPWVSAHTASEAARTGLVPVEGRMSVELRPPLDLDKGVIVRRVIEEKGLEAALFAGDDLGDVTAFRALDAVALPLRVVAASAETPPSLLQAADLVVDGPAGVLDLLRTL